MTARIVSKQDRRALKREIRRRVGKHIRLAFLFSVVTNLLLLVSPIYMLQVYDRILTSGSIDTLVWISLICLYLLVVYGVGDAARRRVFALAGRELEKVFTQRIFIAFTAEDASGSQLSEDVRGVQKVRAALQNGLLAPLFDLPFAPVFLVLLFVVHPFMGVVGVIGMAMLVLLAIAGRIASSGASELARYAEAETVAFATGVARQRNAITSMGMGAEVLDRYAGLRDASGKSSLQVSRRDGSYAASSRAARQGLQIIILGLGGLLAVQQEVSAGAIVAGSILMGRALGPVDMIVNSWRTLMDTRATWKQLLIRAAVPQQETFTALPRPIASLNLSSLSIGVPGAEQPLVKPFSFQAEAGSLVALVGGNGTGKSSLLQTVSGAWEPMTGGVFLGGRDIHKWPAEDRGQHIGYVPQGVELLPGTIRENICRFKNESSDESVINAALKVGAHDVILSLPKGYETRVGPGGAHLSAGQAQAIALARAFYSDPVLVLLDEPTANLDMRAAVDVIETMVSAATSGVTIIVSTHDMRLVEKSDQVVFLSAGSAMLGTPDQFINFQRGRNVSPNFPETRSGGL